MGSTENIWDTFWAIAAAISGLGLPGAIVLLLVCYAVVFLRWICRDSSFAEALRATKPGRRLWVKVSLGTGFALFVLVLPLCALDLYGYGLLVASVVCVVSAFSKSLREATRLSHWAFWLIAAGLTSAFDLAVWAYCASGASAAGLESFFPFIELLLLGCGYFLYQRLPDPGRKDHPKTVALRLVFCMVALVVVDHASAQVSYFLSVRNRNQAAAEKVLTENPYFPVSAAVQEMLDRSAQKQIPADEEKATRKRVDFEQDLARVIAFFLGLAGFNSIVAITSRQFGLRNAKKIPTLAGAPVLADMPELPEPVRRSVFFPNRRYRRGHSALLFSLAVAGNLFVSYMTVYSTAKGNVGHFLLSFVAYSGMLFPPILLGLKNGFRLAAYRARSSLHAVHLLMHTPAYKPLPVRVRRPTILQKLQHKITGAWIRHAQGEDGRLYSVMFGNCPAGEFPAQLYQLRSGPLNESLTGRQAYVAIPRAEAAATAPETAPASPAEAKTPA